MLSVRGLTADYGHRRALSDINLDVFAGEVVALAGENGAGKSTLVRCVAGDLAATAGEILIDNERVRTDPAAVARRGVSVVWQDLALCENLDVASNLLLGREQRSELRSDARFHSTARSLLASLDIPLPDTTASVSSLSGGQRQLLAVARAMRDRPRLLILDEPTASLGVFESRQVESLTRRLSDEGTTILLISHDIDQMFRLADRIAVLRHGRIVAADVPTATGHPDEVVALMSGQPVDTSPRRQLDRLHSLVGRLTSGDPESSLAVILSALGTALAADRLSIHLLDEGRLRMTASVGMPAALHSAWFDLPCAVDGGPPGAAALTQSTVIDADVREAHAWRPFRELAEQAGIRSSWAVPVTAGGGLLGVITVFRRNRGTPHRDEIDLVTLYAGYAASAAERDRLLGEVTARNRVLETIRVVLEELAVSVPLAEGLGIAVNTLRGGLGADTVALLARHPDATLSCRGWASATAAEFSPRADLVAAVDSVTARRDGAPVLALEVDGARLLASHVPAPDGSLALVATWPAEPGRAAVPFVDAPALLEDAARSLQLALERETSERAHREAAALRRSQDLQRAFLSRLSHELRTPLTAIHGYADSLLQTDVEWDDESTSRFLSRIASESARLSRLVADLLDLSAIESNILRLHRDWCDIGLVIDAARDCAPMSEIDRIKLDCEPLPAVWADHDRIEQVLVNLIDNAIRHNPPTTMVIVAARAVGSDHVVITVSDDGVGMAGATSDPSRAVDEPPRSATSGAGLGLSISRAIVVAHGGSLLLDASELGPAQRGTCWRIELPVSGGDPALTPAVVAAADG